jgi:hypothetical protein
MAKHSGLHRRKVRIYGRPRYQIVGDKGRIVDNQNIGRAQKEDRAKHAKKIVKPGHGFEGDQKKLPS